MLIHALLRTGMVNGVDVLFAPTGLIGVRAG